MPSSAADVQVDKTSGEAAEPDIDDDEEYEEIEEEVEVEEEVEIEEEVEVEEEVEEEVDDDEVGEDLTPAREDPDDVSQVTEPKGHEEHPGNPVANLPSDNHAVEGNSRSGLRQTTQNGEFCVDGLDSNHPNIGENLSNYQDCESQDFAAVKKDSWVLAGNRNLKDTKASLSDCGILNVDTKHFKFYDKEKMAAVSMPNAISGDGSNRVLSSGEATKQQDMQLGKDINCVESRFTVPQIRPRSISPGGSYEIENKRPTIICSFFAKGWCIKGNSCRFLHRRDCVDVANLHDEAGSTSVNKKTELMADEGLRDSTEKSLLPNAAVFPVRHNNNSPPLEGKTTQEVVGSTRQMCEAQELPSSKDPSFLSREDVGRENPKQKWDLDDDHGNFTSLRVHGSSPTPKGASVHGIFSSTFMLSDTYHSGVSSHATSFDEITRRNSFLHTDHNLSPLSCSVSSSLLTGEILPSHRIPFSNRLPLPFSSSPWNADPLGIQKLLDSDHASRSASLQRSSSPLSGPKSKKLSCLNVSRDSSQGSGYKTKISTNDWEPSIPFRPSFSCTQYLSSSGSQYDPICDSLEPPNIGGGISKFSFSSEGTSNLSRNWRGYNFGKHLVSGYHIHDKELEMNRSETETVGAAVSHQKDKITLPKEGKLLNHVCVKDGKRKDKRSVDSDSSLQIDGPRQQSEPKIGSTRQSEDINIDIKTDGNMQELKAMKHFRVALIDFVKDEVKPTWVEGHISKDAHKVIVKRVVEKVLSTMKPQQIPHSAELTKQYLFSSQPKIAKLVKGYVHKYRKP